MALAMTVALALTGAIAQAEPARAAPMGDAQRGARLMAQYQCGRCHAIPGVEAANGRIGPPLKGFGARSYIAGQSPNEPARLVQWIIAPASLVPGTTMPALGAGEADARDMAAYLATLR